MGWLQDKIKRVALEVVKEELWQVKWNTRHHACSACGLVYDRNPEEYYWGKSDEQSSYEWLFCKPCREKYQPKKDTLLEWVMANRSKVQALKDKVEGRKGRP